MRQLTYISPSGLKTWLENQDQYYLRYLSDHKPSRDAQTKVMSIGSAFDAFTKSELFERLLGKGHKDWPMYEPDTIFEAQVEPHNRDWAKVEGQFVFERYKSCGALADLVLEIGKAASDPQFEVEVRGTIETRIGAVKHGVPLFGKPDCFFINAEGALVILDWKVNGYCSNSPTSPTQGYKICRDTWGVGDNVGKNSRDNWCPHKKYVSILYKGMEVNGYGYLEEFDEAWAIQTATYGWLHGEAVGVEIITAIDQIVGQRPKLRVASHRSRVSAAFQNRTIQQYVELWKRINSGHFFADLSKEESDKKCALLDQQSQAIFGPDADPTFAALVKPAYRPPPKMA